MGRPKKTKITVIESKVKKVTQIAKNVNLEQNIKKEEKAEFQEFMSSGVRVTPVLNSGQRQDIEETAQEVQVETRAKNPNQGAMVKPEFSVYEQARTNIPVSTGVRQRQYVEKANPDRIMDQAIHVEKVQNVRPTLGRTTGDINFVNQELESVRSGNRDYYDEKMKIEKQKQSRRMPWEIE